jgi:hypothetical protein
MAQGQLSLLESDQAEHVTRVVGALEAIARETGTTVAELVG